MFQHRKLSQAVDWRSGDGCFNGAGVFQHRKHRIFNAIEKRGALLQWSRCVSTPETIRLGFVALRWLGFNGAGVFQHRKLDLHRIDCELQRNCFNGAGVFQHRKPANPDAILVVLVSASMEPVCFNTGNKKTSPFLLSTPTASMEPVCFNTGNTETRLSRAA